MIILCLDELVLRGEQTACVSTISPIQSDFERRFQQDLYHLVHGHNEFVVRREHDSAIVSEFE